MSRKNKSPKILMIDIQQDFSDIPSVAMEKIHIEKHIEFSKRLMKSGLLSDVCTNDLTPIEVWPPHCIIGTNKKEV